MGIKYNINIDKLSDEEIEKFSNGCGPNWIDSGGIFNKILGLSVKRICHIHDYDYGYSEDKRPKTKLKYDNIFLRNLLHVIWRTGGILAIPRSIIAIIYYVSVLFFGWRSFKNS